MSGVCGGVSRVPYDIGRNIAGLPSGSSTGLYVVGSCTQLLLCVDMIA